MENERFEPYISPRDDIFLSLYHYDKNHRQLSYRVVHIDTLDGSDKWEERKAGVTLHRVQGGHRTSLTPKKKNICINFKNL